MTVEKPDESAGSSPTAVSSQADATREPGERSAPQQGSVWVDPEGSRSRRSLLRALAALGITVVSAVVLGLLIVVFQRAVSGDSSGSKSTPPALAIPSTGRPPASVVPADWVEQTSDSGLVFRAPPGWTQRTDPQIDYRVEPPPGGPNAGQVGVGLMTSTTDPNAAALSYATGTYSGQPSYQQQPPIDEVSARGERGRQVTVAYTRSGTPVTVVVRAFPTSRGVVLIATRGPQSDPQRADRLADAVDASLRLQ
jgi:hypothetical protein